MKVTSPPKAAAPTLRERERQPQPCRLGRAYDLIRMMTSEGRATGIGHAFAAYGRIFTTLHLLQIFQDEMHRRMIGAQLNIGESRHSLARKVFFGSGGHLRRSYELGMEDQLGALGLGSMRPSGGTACIWTRP